MEVIKSFRQGRSSIFEKHARRNLRASQGGYVTITKIMLLPCLDVSSQDSNGDTVDDQGSSFADVFNNSILCKKKKLVKRFGAALVTVLGSQGIIILTCSKLVTALLFQDMTSFYCMLGTSQTVLGCQSELSVSLSTGHWAN